MAASPESGSSEGLREDEVALLLQRASRYAQKPEERAGDISEAVIFVRGPTRYAAPLSALREVRPLRTFCRVPGAAAAVPGLIHYRGEILSVHDLAAFMDPTAAGKDASWVLVAEHRGERIALLGDEIIDIEAFSAARVLPVPITFGERGACFEGVLPGGTLLLSPPRLFAIEGFFCAF
jgi:chemotaxis signal transduction protein